MKKSDDGLYSHFIYFIECYFNWSMDYADLESLIEDYISRENPIYIIGLRAEVNVLYALDNPRKIKELVYTYGTRTLKLEQAGNMIGLLHKKLN